MTDVNAKCPRCHKEVPSELQSCPYCHMLLRFEKKTGTFDKFVNSLLDNELDEDGICVVSSSASSTGAGEIANHNYLVGFFYTLDKMLSRFFIGAIILIILFWLIGPLLALPLIFLRDKAFWMFMAFLVAAMPFAGAINYRYGKCPYCHEELNGLPQNNALTCKTCKNRVLVKNNKFYKIEK